MQFCLISGFFPSFVFNGLYLLVLRKLPQSFTLGELALVLQGYVIFLYNSFIQVPYYYNHPPFTTLSQMTAILQVGFLGVSTIAAITFLFPIFRKTSTFYCLLISIVFTVMALPVTRDLPVITLVKFIFSNSERLFFTSYFAGLLGLTASVVWWHVTTNQSSSTVIRKIFHLLIVLVFVPGLIYECTYLYVASGVIFAIFIVIEIARIIKLYPVYDVLQTSIQSFIDEKDAGIVALTPLYLLAGCSIPFWLHVCPCDLTDSTVFEFLPLIAGVLAVGIGDTAASYFGSKYGKHKWNGMDKSMEGTAANVLSQVLAILLFNQLGLVRLCSKNVSLSIMAITATAIAEAKTDQVDNLVLPIISFIFLSVP